VCRCVALLLLAIGYWIIIVVFVLIIRIGPCASRTGAKQHVHTGGEALSGARERRASTTRYFLDDI